MRSDQVNKLVYLKTFVLVQKRSSGALTWWKIYKLFVRVQFRSKWLTYETPLEKFVDCWKLWTPRQLWSASKSFNFLLVRPWLIVSKCLWNHLKFCVLSYWVSKLLFTGYSSSFFSDTLESKAFNIYFLKLTSMNRFWTVCKS